MDQPAGIGTETLVPAARLLLRTLGHRLALLALEIEEASPRLASGASLLGIAAGACVLTGVAANLLVAAIFWDTPHRLAALAVLCALQLAAAVAATVRLRRAWKAWQPFGLTQSALQEDLRWLRRLLDE